MAGRTTAKPLKQQTTQPHEGPWDGFRFQEPGAQGNRCPQHVWPLSACH